MIKACLFIVSFFLSSSAMERPPLLSVIEDRGSQSGSEDALDLSDFEALKNRAGKLCKIIPKNISSEFKILRVHSEGEVEKLDCNTIDLNIRIECSRAAGILASIKSSNSILAISVAQEKYNNARAQYQNALHHILMAFNLNCYKPMEKLHQVLTAFIDAETDATRRLSTRKLDAKTQNLYYSLEEIVRKVEEERRTTVVSQIPMDTTKDLVNALNGNQTLKNGYSHLNAGRTLLKNLHDPTLESLNLIEITFFAALEYFISAYYRDVNQGLGEAENTLKEIEAVHEFKKNKFGKEGQRYTLAKIKLEEVKKTSTEYILEDAKNATTEHHKEEHSHSDFERFLREEATQQRPASSADASYSSKKKRHSMHVPSESTTQESSETTQESKPTPLSLFKLVWRNTKSGTKAVWKKLPF